MTYSRNGRLLFRGATFAVALAFVAYAKLFHPSQNVVPYLMGATLGMGIAPLIFVGILLQPSLLEVLATALGRHPPHMPWEYYLLGMMVTLIAQAICSLGISLATRLKPGA